MLGALLCGASGALLAHFLGAFSPKDFYFNLTFLLLSMLILGGITTVSGAVGGTAMIVLLVDALRRMRAGGDFGIVTLPPVFGLTDIGIGLVILTVMYRLREGLFGVRELDERLGLDDTLTVAPAYTPAPTGSAENLTVENVSKFCRADGAGKRQLRDRTWAGDGADRPEWCGEIDADQCDLRHHPAVIGPGDDRQARCCRQLAVHDVSRAGLGRTFQNIRLFKNLTVLENVRVAANSVAGMGDDPVAAARAALAVVGLDRSGPAHAPTTLPYGAQRRLEVARALALRPRFLLLDEPAAGMNPTETDSLMEVLRRIRVDHQLGLLVAMRADLN